MCNGARWLQSLVTRAQPGTELGLGTDARGWSTAVGARGDLMHAVEADLDASAVRIAGEQAALRAGVGAILVSLSRRLQLRTDTVMINLDGLERDEQDPDRLKKLFDLDHVATVIRRLIFNLQVLAGGRGGRARDGAVRLTDLLRAQVAVPPRHLHGHLGVGGQGPFPARVGDDHRVGRERSDGLGLPVDVRRDRSAEVDHR